VPRALVLGFGAGFVSVLVFHQGTVFLMHHLAGLFGTPGYSFRPTGSFGVPSVLNAAFWGGVWGIAIAALLRWRRDWPDLLTGLLVGAIGATLVGYTLVAALKGLPLMGGWDPARWWRGMLVNGAFGFGTALLLRPFRIRGPAGAARPAEATIRPGSWG
jgi:hypothetical protein